MANNKFDGSNGFCGVNSTAIGDGTGGDTEPFDAWLENMVDNGVRSLWEDMHAGWSPPRVSGTRRKLATAVWGTILYARITVSNSLDSVEIVLDGDIGVDTSDTGPAVDFRGRIWSPDQTRIWYSSGSPFSNVKGNLPDTRLMARAEDQTEPESEVWGIFELQMRSYIDTTQLISPASDLVLNQHENEDIQIGPGYTDTGDASDVSAPFVDPAQCAVSAESDGSNPDTKRIYDQIFVREDGGDVERFFYDATQNDEGGKRTIERPAVYPLTWFKPESVHLRKNYDSDKSDRYYTPKDGGSMKPNEPPQGELVLENPDNLDAIHGRAQTQTIGGDTVYPDDYEQVDAHASWDEPDTWVNAYIIGSSSAQVFERQALTFDKLDSIVRVHLHFAPYVKRNDGTAQGLGKLAGESPGASWRIGAELKHLQTGDTNWSNAETLASTSKDIVGGPDNSDEFPHWEMLRSPICPFHQQVISMGLGSQSTQSGTAKTHRNGILYNDPEDGELNDHNLLFPMTMELEPDDSRQAIREDFVRLELSARVLDPGGSLPEAAFMLIIPSMHVEEESSIPAQAI